MAENGTAGQTIYVVACEYNRPHDCEGGIAISGVYASPVSARRASWAVMREHIRDYQMACDGLTRVDVPIRAIVAAALGANAHGVLVAHNHPSGDPEPSVGDRTLTRRIHAALELFEIELVDHLVVGAASYCSFQETGRMRRYARTTSDAKEAR